ANRHVEATRPWALSREDRAGSAEASRRLNAVLYELTEVCRLVAEGLRPFLPDTAERIATALNMSLATSWTDGLGWGGVRPGRPAVRPAPLFLRPDLASRNGGRAGAPGSADAVSGP